MLRFELSYGLKPRYLYYTINGKVDITSNYAWAQANFMIKGEGTSESPYLFKLSSESKINLSKIFIFNSDSYIKIIDSNYHTVKIEKSSNISLSESKFQYVGFVQSVNVTFTNILVKRRAFLFSCNNMSLNRSQIRAINLLRNNYVCLTQCQVKILNRIRNEPEPQVIDSHIKRVNLKKSFELTRFP